MFSPRSALSATVSLRTQQLLAQEEVLLLVRLPPALGAQAPPSPLQLLPEVVAELVAELAPLLLQPQARDVQEPLQTVAPLLPQLFRLAPRLALRAQPRRSHVTSMTMLASASLQLRAL